MALFRHSRMLVKVVSSVGYLLPVQGITASMPTLRYQCQIQLRNGDSQIPSLHRALEPRFDRSISTQRHQDTAALTVSSA